MLLLLVYLSPNTQFFNLNSLKDWFIFSVKDVWMTVKRFFRGYLYRQNIIDYNKQIFFNKPNPWLLVFKIC